MKKNIHRTLLYLLLSPLSFMALGQLPSIDPLPEKFRSVCHGRVDSIVEKRTLPDTDCGLQIYYFDNRNRIKNIVNYNPKNEKSKMEKRKVKENYKGSLHWRAF